MNKEEKQVEANKLAWSKLAKDHYTHYKEKLLRNELKLNPMVDAELGNIQGKKVLHLQCNTGADSVLLARKGAIVTGVDIVPENILYARKLAKECGQPELQFVESDILKLMDAHKGQYDIVLTTDGVIGWLPDLNQWGKVIAHFLKPEGCFYLHDGHPFMLIFDEDALDKGELVPRYPYFKQTADLDDSIGGYAGEAEKADNYYWGHQLSTIINGLLSGGLFITYIKEYDRCVPGMGGSTLDENGLSYYPELEGKLPLILSLKAEKKT